METIPVVKLERPSRITQCHYTTHHSYLQQLYYMHWQVVFQENVYVLVIRKVQYIKEDQSMESFKKFLTTNEINDEPNTSTRKGF
jgi:hypothetical protein